MVPFHILRMVSYYCAIVTLSARRNFFLEIWLQKMLWPWNRVKGPSRSLKISPFDRAHMTYYWRSVWLYLVSFLSYSMSENIATLKSQSRVNQGHWMLYHSIDCLCGFRLVFYSNLAPKTYSFWDIRLQICRDLQNLVRVRQGHWNITIR